MPPRRAKHGDRKAQRGEAKTSRAGKGPKAGAVPPPEPFRPPAYPYDRLKPLRAKAAALAGGAVDLSVGSPCDPPSRAVLSVLASADEGGAARSYPSSAGSPEAREAISQWMAVRIDAWAPPEHIGLCIGAKELVAGLPSMLHLRDRSRDTVLYPELSYPTYQMGALLAGLRAVPVPVDEEFRLRLSPDAVSEEDAARALVLWVNSPGNPAGQLDDLRAAAAWGRQHGALVASDECYVEHIWSMPPRTVLGHGEGSGGLGGVLAVHSLSKRSNLAGLRFGWYAGDPDVVAFLREVRQHAGFMVPGPVQRAGIAALGDQQHAEAQRQRYWDRLVRLQEVLAAAGVEAPLPEGGIYLWAPAPNGDAWALAERLAERGGLVVSPGEFYGKVGAGYVRVAAVAPMDRIELVASRLERGSRRAKKGLAPAKKSPTRAEKVPAVVRKAPSQVKKAHAPAKRAAEAARPVAKKARPVAKKARPVVKTARPVAEEVRPTRVVEPAPNWAKPPAKAAPPGSARAQAKRAPAATKGALARRRPGSR